MFEKLNDDMLEMIAGGAGEGTWTPFSEKEIDPDKKYMFYHEASGARTTKAVTYAEFKESRIQDAAADLAKLYKREYDFSDDQWKVGEKTA